ncbi:hypothetical protein RDI58_007817 [Solanum bulbocastanum]|uniref:Uncharacterized protein n=1 Tax=Solanum bulbocastanum TaxID=147425 RepID=A0AAN8YI20_SOLBU
MNWFPAHAEKQKSYEYCCEDRNDSKTFSWICYEKTNPEREQRNSGVNNTKTREPCGMLLLYGCQWGALEADDSILSSSKEAEQLMIEAPFSVPVVIEASVQDYCESKPNFAELTSLIKLGNSAVWTKSLIAGMQRIAANHSFHMMYPSKEYALCCVNYKQFACKKAGHDPISRLLFICAIRRDT